MNQNENLIQMILEPKSLERLERIRIMDKKRAGEIENCVIDGFKKTGRTISDDGFVQMLGVIEDKRDKTNVVYRRRRNDADLENIEDI